MLRTTRCTPVFESRCANSEMSTSNCDSPVTGWFCAMAWAAFSQSFPSKGGTRLEIFSTSHEVKAELDFRLLTEISFLYCLPCHSSKAAIVILAVASHEYALDRSSPCLAKSRRSSSSFNTSAIFAAMSFSLKGLNKASSLPMTSGRLVVLATMTGAPQDIASRAGKPKPSCQEGKTNKSHRL